MVAWVMIPPKCSFVVEPSDPLYVCGLSDFLTIWTRQSTRLWHLSNRSRPARLIGKNGHASIIWMLTSVNRGEFNYCTGCGAQCTKSQLNPAIISLQGTDALFLLPFCPSCLFTNCLNGGLVPPIMPSCDSRLGQKSLCAKQKQNIGNNVKKKMPIII